MRARGYYNFVKIKYLIYKINKIYRGSNVFQYNTFSMDRLRGRYTDPLGVHFAHTLRKSILNNISTSQTFISSINWYSMD